MRNADAGFSTRFRCAVAAIGATLTLIAVALPAAAALVPPPGYYGPVGHSDEAFRCPDMPTPFTGTLDFPSKYEGSGKARDQLNEASDAEYKAKSKPISDMEKGINKIVDKYMETGKPEALQCALAWYGAWSHAHALLGNSVSHTGKSVRKWSLASLSGAWLHLKFSSSKPLAAYPEQTQQIESWLNDIVNKVVTEWDENAPPEKLNNHFYWAAWSVMATSIVTDRRDLFDWATRIYNGFAEQVDAEGYLHNELVRNTRALSYHNFAITPLAMIAAFGKANGVNLPDAGGGALTRLANRTLQGIAKPQVFQDKTGYRQLLEGLDEPGGKLVWLEPYCWSLSCSAAIISQRNGLRPLKNARLGGNMTRVFEKD